MTDSEKHSSLLQNRINCARKKFYITGPRKASTVVVVAKKKSEIKDSILTIARGQCYKIYPYPSKAPFRCSTLGSAPGLTSKHKARLERLARDKRSSLLQKFVTYGRKQLYNIGPCAIKFLRWSVL